MSLPRDNWAGNRASAASHRRRSHVLSGAAIPFYPEPVACTDEMDLSQSAELVFDYKYHGFRSSALGKHIDL